MVFIPRSLVESFLPLSMLQNGGKGNWYFAEGVFRGSKGMFRAPARPTFAPGGKSRQKRHSNLRFENPPTLCSFDFDSMYHAFTEQSRCRAV